METNTQLCPCCKKMPFQKSNENTLIDGWCHFCKIFIYAEHIIVNRCRAKKGLSQVSTATVVKEYPMKRMRSPVAYFLADQIERNALILTDSKMMEATVQAIGDIMVKNV